jgi:hypothetical protein
MSRDSKIGRNDTCPCGNGKKYKYCCMDKIDWPRIFQERADIIPHLSNRGRNILFANKIAEALQLDSQPTQLSQTDFKNAFTTEAVRNIHESIMEVWPPELNINSTLQKSSGQVSGLYIGDYQPEYILKGLVRHSIYSNKILVIDPFVYPTSMREEFNPILNPNQYRAQTLKNVNFWAALTPWIEEGIVEIIRTPADFDPKLHWESMQRQMKKFEENEELKKAKEISVSELGKRMEEPIRDVILSAPNEYLERMYNENGLDKGGISSKEFIAYIEKRREQDPNFLEIVEPGSGQLYMFSTGTSYDMAVITSNLTGSYLVTDIYSRWKEIEIDREQRKAQNKDWEPFAKAFQQLDLKCLNDLSLEHALLLRKEQHLESFRVFLRSVWKSACSTESFSEANVQLLCEELTEEIKKAEEEWKSIDRKLLKWFGASIVPAASMVASGNPAFLAAATIAISGLMNLGISHAERNAFPTKFPAAFFLK